MDDIVLTRLVVFLLFFMAAAVTVFGVYAALADRTIKGLREENLVLQAKLAAWLQWAEEQDKDEVGKP